MSRLGCPYDNAMAESFMKTLKTEEVDGQAYRDLPHATGSDRQLHRGGLQPSAAALRPRLPDIGGIRSRFTAIAAGARPCCNGITKLPVSIYRVPRQGAVQLPWWWRASLHLGVNPRRLPSGSMTPPNRSWACEGRHPAAFTMRNAFVPRGPRAERRDATRLDPSVAAAVQARARGRFPSGV